MSIDYTGFRDPEMSKFVNEELKPMKLSSGVHNMVLMALKQGQYIQRTVSKGLEVWEYNRQAKDEIIQILRNQRTITQKKVKEIGRRGSK